MTTDPFMFGITSGATTLYLGERNDGGVALALAQNGVTTEIALDAQQVEALCHALVSNLARALTSSNAENEQV